MLKKFDKFTHFTVDRNNCYAGATASTSYTNNTADITPSAEEVRNKKIAFLTKVESGNKQLTSDVKESASSLKDSDSSSESPEKCKYDSCG